jgi:HEPN domain-containing protein
MTSRDHALVLLRKATDDATAARKFADDPEIADAIVGFHAQQAVEKALKAVLSVVSAPIHGPTTCGSWWSCLTRLVISCQRTSQRSAG